MNQPVFIKDRVVFLMGGGVTIRRDFVILGVFPNRKGVLFALVHVRKLTWGSEAHSDRLNQSPMYVKNKHFPTHCSC